MQSSNVKFNREVGKEQGPFSCKLLHLWLCALTGEHKQQGVSVGTSPCIMYILIPLPPPHPSNHHSTHKCHLSLLSPGRLFSRRIRCYFPFFPISILSTSALPSLSVAFSLRHPS